MSDLPTGAAPPAVPPAPLSDARLAELRREFPILHTHTYLNSCSLGALSNRAEDRLGEFLELWHTMGASAWYEHWLGRLAELRQRVEGLLGAGAGEVALSPSTSVALASFTESLDFEKRPRVVIADLDFPTLGHQFQVKPEVELVVVRSRDGIGVMPEQFAEAVDERTALLATSHVFYATGFRQDLQALGRIAREAGALSLIDGYQGAGQIEVDVAAAGIDAYTTGPLKWLLGGPGLSYLWVRPELIGELEPRITSWFAARDQFEFGLEGFEFHADARRFEMGTPALPTVHTALGGQEILDELGMDVVEARNRSLTRRLEAGLEARGFRLRAAPDKASRTAIVIVEHPRAPEAVEALARDGVIVDHRPGCVRVSPHVYNTTEEIDRFVEALPEA